MKIKVKAEGRNDVWLPEKESLKQFIVSKKYKIIHNFVQSGSMIIGADHDVQSVLQDIDKADRISIFTNPNVNMGHSMAIVNEKLECYELGEIKLENLEIIE